MKLFKNDYILKQLQYINAYDPKYWLFEGQTGGQDSASSVQHLFRAAAYMLEAGVDIRYIQELLGRSHIDTTVIYTHVAQNRLSGIVSPLDQIKVKPVYPQ